MNKRVPTGRLRRVAHWVEKQRGQPLWHRVLPPITLVLAVFAVRILASCHHPTGSFEFFLPALALAGTVFGPLPGLAAAVAAYALEALWFVGLARGLDLNHAQHWNHAVIAVLFGLISVSMTALIEVMWWLVMGYREDLDSW
jgi:hypothetical protein